MGDFVFLTRLGTLVVLGIILVADDRIPYSIGFWLALAGLIIQFALLWYEVDQLYRRIQRIRELEELIDTQVAKVQSADQILPCCTSQQQQQQQQQQPPEKRNMVSRINAAKVLDIPKEFARYVYRGDNLLDVLDDRIHAVTQMVSSIANDYPGESIRVENYAGELQFEYRVQVRKVEPKAKLGPIVKLPETQQPPEPKPMRMTPLPTGIRAAELLPHGKSVMLTGTVQGCTRLTGILELKSAPMFRTLGFEGCVVRYDTTTVTGYTLLPEGLIIRVPGREAGEIEWSMIIPTAYWQEWLKKNPEN